MPYPSMRRLPTRRAMLALGVAAASWPARSARSETAHGLLGPVEPPRAAPPLPLTLHDGRGGQLPALLQGRITALQLMFTGCTATCPVQGAVFAALQGLVVGALPRAQLLSVSIDALADDAPALDRWRHRLGAGPAWLAAVPPVRHAEVMLDFIDGRPGAAPGGAPAGERHRAQVVLFDAQGRLAYRCAELAGARDIAHAMRELARRS